MQHDGRVCVLLFVLCVARCVLWVVCGVTFHTFHVQTDGRFSLVERVECRGTGTDGPSWQHHDLRDHNFTRRRIQSKDIKHTPTPQENLIMTT